MLSQKHHKALYNSVKPRHDSGKAGAFLLAPEDIERSGGTGKSRARIESGHDGEIWPTKQKGLTMLMCIISKSIPGKDTLAWINVDCTSNISGPDPSGPIAAARAYSRIIMRGQMSSNPEETSSNQNPAQDAA